MTFGSTQLPGEVTVGVSEGMIVVCIDVTTFCVVEGLIFEGLIFAPNDNRK